MEKDHPAGKSTTHSMNSNHPSAIIASKQAALIREHAFAAEQLKQLHPAQLEMIYQQKWFQLFVPKSMGGLELSLPEALQLEESLAWADGSLGWTVTLCAGANWFIGFLNPQLAAVIFSNEKVCLAGSGKPNGVAKKIKEGYDISGTWNYATGAPHATAFTANCVIEENGKSLVNDNGELLIIPFLFLKDEVLLHDNWKSMGMIATASQAFEVKQLTVGEDRVFMLDSAHAVINSPIYQYPFLQFAEATLAVNVSGMTMRFLELCDDYFSRKASDAMAVNLKEAKQVFSKTRALLYSVVEESWNKCMHSLPMEEELLMNISLACKQVVLEARRSVNTLFPCCGLAALDPASEINRLWRNFHTATQHTLLNGCA
jgi:hypothetical protein